MEGVTPDPHPHHPRVRYNVVIHAADAGFFGLALGLASFVTVFPLFVRTLTDSAVLIGLIGALHPLGWHLPQLVTAKRVAGLRRFLPMVMLTTSIERVPFFLLAGLVWLSASLPKGLTLALTFSLVFLIGLGGGLTATAFQSMVGKIMPPWRRGAFYGIKTAAANGMLMLGAVIAGRLIDHVAYPHNFSLCFALAGMATLVSWAILGRTWEVDAAPLAELGLDGDGMSGGVGDTPDGISDANIDGLSSVTSESPMTPPLRTTLTQILKRDPHFRWFLLSRSLSQLANMATAFYTVYGVTRFGIDGFTAGLMTGTFAGAQTLANPLMGWLGDRRGHGWVMKLGMLAAAAGALLALAAPSAGWLYGVFVLAGIANVAAFTMPLAINLQLAPPAHRPAYIGLANTLFAPSIALATLLGGLLAQKFGYQATFLAAAAGGLATALVLHFRVAHV